MQHNTAAAVNVPLYFHAYVQLQVLFDHGLVPWCLECCLSAKAAASVAGYGQHICLMRCFRRQYL